MIQNSKMLISNCQSNSSFKMLVNYILQTFIYLGQNFLMFISSCQSNLAGFPHACKFHDFFFVDFKVSIKLAASKECQFHCFNQVMHLLFINSATRIISCLNVKIAFPSFCFRSSIGDLLEAAFPSFGLGQELEIFWKSFNPNYDDDQVNLPEFLCLFKEVF